MTDRKQFLGVLGAGLFAACSTPRNEEKKAEAPKPRGDHRIYVTNEASGDLTVIDSASLEAIKTLPLGKRPRGIRASPDGKLIYVALSGSPFAPPGVDESTLPPPDRGADGVGVVDAAKLEVVKIIRAGQDPESFDLSRDGRYLYVSNEDDAKVSVVDLSSDSVAASVAVGGEPEGVTLTPDGKFVYVTSEEEGTITAIDTAANKGVKTFRVGRRPRAVVFLPDGSRGFVSLENNAAVAVVDARKHALVTLIDLGDKDVKPMGLALTKDGGRLFVSTGRFHKVFEIDTAANKPVASWEAGERPWGIGLSPDEKTLYTANGPAGDVSVIDVATRTVRARVKAADRPWGILVLPAPPAG
ncbi:MAG: beta-propeller fold lactonase family protein [Bryobacteraceae bacterium]